VRQALERHRAHRLAQQLPALLDLIGRHVVHAHELGMLDMVLLVASLDALEHRISRPGVPAGTRLRHLREPELQPLMARISRQQPVQCRRAASRQARYENRLTDLDGRVLRVRRPAGLAHQPGR
jgi:hypothetical protein